MTLVCLPFVVFGEEFVFPLLESREQRIGAVSILGLALLAVDSVAPVPSTLVIMYVANQAGWLAGIAVSTVGLSLGVVAAAWFGRTAVGRVAPKFMPESEIVRLRATLERRLMVTLACLRSVPVLAETSVIVAAAAGVPPKRIFAVTLLPNLIVAAIYSVAADDSFATAAVVFLATMVVSYALWRWLGRGSSPATAG